MKKVVLFAVIGMLFISLLQAGHPTSRVFPLSKTKFAVNEKGADGEKIVDLTGQNFIVASVREKGADGIAYAVDSDGVVWWAAVISSGAKGHETPSGIFDIFRKERFHMSGQHPDPKGINNMDFSLWFTQQGHAIHMGNDDAMSHGCIHVGAKGAASMFNWATIGGTKIVVTREHYLPFVYYDLKKAGYKEGSHTPAHIKAYLKTMVPIKPRMPDTAPKAK
ncbi:MAG: L,D-transpeptidase [Campylobacterota bacterium]|nr:L,D-transpeptidase [Campylobacterota bacterium]